MDLKRNSSKKKKKKNILNKKSSKINNKQSKKGLLKKNKYEKDKLGELYKLEIENFKKEKDQKNEKLTENLELINDDYDNIKEISKKVNDQINLYKVLLRTRILSQKVLSLSNKLPLLSFVSLKDKMLDNDNLSKDIRNSLNEVKCNEEKLKDDIGDLLTILHNFLKKYFLKCDIQINENLFNELNIINDEEDKLFYENRRKLYNEDTTKNEKKLFSIIDTWFLYSKKMCLNFFDIMHKITKISSTKSLKTYEQSISSQINQVMFELPSLIENSYPEALNYEIVGKKLYELLYKDERNFNLNKHIYDDEIYYKKFLLNAIQILKNNQEDSELLKSQREIYKIKKKYDNNNVNRGKILSYEPIPKLVNFMLPEPPDWKNESLYEYVNNPELINVLLSSLFQD
ncbi:conserved Plasmodium protein, unknown function [Plasmodium gallinaceum]|uniref:AATF leucine zipper-containing domain-containing protein n=1 Tax=Plasmodium gallinaceum TaxID=5849 RepID=A0A1J1GUJ9_PLAGA|nr:conserved Plasmodium protein, unknown function [Plasmodium gallinaceum]CRG95977.1 conserved Plasmodium protein, unknown function [Plasmodium gallinaceum]